MFYVVSAFSVAACIAAK